VLSLCSVERGTLALFYFLGTEENRQIGSHRGFEQASQNFPLNESAMPKYVCYVAYRSVGSSVTPQHHGVTRLWVRTDCVRCCAGDEFVWRTVRGEVLVAKFGVWLLYSFRDAENWVRLLSFLQFRDIRISTIVSIVSAFLLRHLLHIAHLYIPFT
jgi:hypothetical protein